MVGAIGLTRVGAIDAMFVGAIGSSEVDGSDRSGVGAFANGRSSCTTTNRIADPRSAISRYPAVATAPLHTHYCVRNAISGFTVLARRAGT